MRDVVVATWGVGKVYRDRVKHNIRKANSFGYKDTLPYTILTDEVDYFDDLVKEFPGKIIAVLDIVDERKKHCSWDSENYEHIVLTKDEREYGKNYRDKVNKKNELFSYALNRFSLPTLSARGYNKFLLCDCDVDIRYDLIDVEFSEAEFWNQFNTPPNTLKGCDLEVFDSEIHKEDSWRYDNITASNILKYLLGDNHADIFSRKAIQTEGPFRYYHFHDANSVMKYFNLWDRGMMHVLTKTNMRNQFLGGNYMYIDNIVFSTACYLMRMNMENFDKKYHHVNVYLKDRHFFPNGNEFTVDGEKLSLQPSDDMGEFMNINSKLINHLKQIGRWDG